MDREEILAKSKRENRGQDIADLETSKAGLRTGYIVIICALCAVAVAEALVYERMNCGIFFAVMAGSGSVFLYKYLKLRKTHELVMTVVYAAAAAGFLIAWIVQLTRA